jgi:hypothetical protein
MIEQRQQAVSNDLVVHRGHDAGRGWPPPSEDKSATQRVRRLLEFTHDRNAVAPINHPDEHGAFVSTAPLWGTLGRGVQPIVADANKLRDDILHACRRRHRTVLINAANAGATRIFCASHVLAEVEEHAEEWASESGDVRHEQFRACWSGEYLPLIRRVRDEDVPFDLLDPAESRRIADLRAEDPDDVPSATLALALGAFFLSEDIPALRAVYGPGVNIEEHRAWLEVLKAGGDAGELSTMTFGAMMVPTVATAGLFRLSRWLARTYSPWLLPLIALGVGLFVAQLSPDARKKVGSALAQTGTALLNLYAAYEAACERFEAAAPQVPTWASLVQTNDRRTVLARACLYELARSLENPASAQMVARALPRLGVGQGEQLVRETLRLHGCFDRPYRGLWQVGHVAGQS